MSITYLPLLWDVRLGNTALLTLALCWAAWRVRERPRLAGALFAGAIGIKLLPATIVLFLIAAGRWRIAAWIALSGIAAIAATWPLVGAAWGDYVTLLTAIAGSQPSAGSNVIPEAFGTGPARALLPLAGVALAGGAGWAARQNPRETNWFCVALAATPFLSGTVWYPYLTLVLPLLIFVTATQPISTGALQPGRGDLTAFGLAWLALQYHAIQQPTRDFTLPFYGTAGLIFVAIARHIVTHLRAPHPPAAASGPPRAAGASPSPR